VEDWHSGKTDFHVFDLALYKRSGYVEVKAFNAEPYAHHWFEKTLGKKTQSGRVQ